MKFFDAFSGYGGFHLGIERAYEKLRFEDEKQQMQRARDAQGQTIEFNNGGTNGLSCIGYSEIDKYASAVYKYHFGGTNYGDITKINPAEFPDFDLFCGGFPCQSFSIAGKRLGFADTRGTLFFDIIRILKEKRPRNVLLENVKGLLSHESGRTFKTIISTLAELGYSVEWQVLNAKNFGVPQNRERVFIIGHLGGFGGRQVFPIRQNDGLDNQTQRTQKQEIHRCLEATEYKGVSSERFSGVQDRLRSDEPSPLKEGNISNSPNSIRRVSYTDGARIRRITPLECERLMGLPDDWTKIGEFGNGRDFISDTQRYKLCGNGVVVNCVEEIIKRLFMPPESEE